MKNKAPHLRDWKESLTDQQFKAFVLDGVTGSGKTEVYLDAAAEALKKNQQVLILLPEIALSPMLQNRFLDRFGTPPIVWHSALTRVSALTPIVLLLAAVRVSLSVRVPHSSALSRPCHGDC